MEDRMGWYDAGRAKMREEACSDLEIDAETFDRVYTWLSGIGLIDYDIEKDVIQDLYV
jgi:hypothetical protein